MADQEPVKVLIVDDDEEFAASNRDLLEAYGYVVDSAPDGRTGLAKAHAMRPDIMILDVMMTTDTEGFEVARKIPESPELRRMGVLLVTGMSRELHLQGRLKSDDTWLPVDRILDKPIAPQQLMAEIERVLAEKRGGKRA